MIDNIVIFILVYFGGVLAAINFTYPNDPSIMILWCPVWIITILPIRVVKLVCRGFIGLIIEILKELKNEN